MTDEPIRIGVLGYRFMGKAHANALDRLPMFFDDAPETERHTVIGRDEAALAEAADTLGFSHTATDWRDVVDEVDAFYNLGPNHLHVEPTIAALEAGTPVLCEKPLAPTLEGAERMRDAAREADVPVGCAFNYRFVPAIRYAKRLIDDGELGEIRQVRGRYLQDWLSDPEAPWSWRNDEEMAGSGALGDLGAHTVDLARFLVGDRAGEAASVSGHLRTFTEERPVEGADDDTRPVTVDDAYSAQVEYESGAMGTFEASRVTEGHKNDHTVAVHGSEGSLEFSLERLNELRVNTGDNRGYETVLVTDADDPYIEHWWPPGHVIGWEHTFVHENYEFLSAVRDDAAFAPDFEDAFAVQRVLDAVQRSDAEGVRVALD
ncbi:Gfo/Idh/MocA family protein [Halobaculum lipolyticum]|uniref:Gfo/Idh/MocA family protein n=1 Tax=Halobaculum lipolyticum TaxID=3032001 RepID=A0ABD5W9U4_9EURY|nr:Gfo/Idh/MocA family oxidoreductase [Halobaculum sp. DT31]